MKRNINLFVAFVISAILHIALILLFIFKSISHNTNIAKEKSSEEAFGISFAQISDANQNSDALAKETPKVEQQTQEVQDQKEIEVREEIKEIKKEIKEIKKEKKIKKPKPKPQKPTEQPKISKEKPQEIEEKREPAAKSQPNIAANNNINTAGGTTQSGVSTPDRQGGSNLDGEIYKALKKHMSYPKKAIEQEIQGRVIVEFKQIDNENFEYIRIVQSSGHKVLDNHAIKIVNNARYSLPVESYNINIKTPIVFDLNEI
ncbi:energy transducer TonB [Campylobacter sp. CCUG 57310]|uniref:TonB family protein n=1 Tax=Campylobacter sp. CCUG 57310 TaxID=2517362 RepID=UPI001565D030|nr:energy transducer TonB [Campylobacter sp. CCUG 57310]QKF93120.1 energy transduction protein TonB [Campylobacter sp. CCUG 57310]